MSVSQGGTGTTTGLRKIGNVAIVAQSGGDYTSPVDAMSAISSWCGTPSASNPCLVKIMPGVYDLGSGTLAMRSYVDIEGSGEEVTVIKGAWNSTVDDQRVVHGGLVDGASNAEIRFLTVMNAGTAGTYNAAIANNSASPKITHVTATASGGSSSYGVYNNTNSSLKADRSTFIGGVGNVNSNFFIGSSKLVGTVSNSSGGTITCVASYNGDYVALRTGCLPTP